jgi:hypothetical protein
VEQLYLRGNERVVEIRRYRTYNIWRDPMSDLEL